ncbi:hypothetical protein COOONC_19294 [Cooperia oncophora]
MGRRGFFGGRRFGGGFGPMGPMGPGPMGPGPMGPIGPAGPTGCGMGGMPPPPPPPVAESQFPKMIISPCVSLLPYDRRQATLIELLEFGEIFILQFD